MPGVVGSRAVCDDPTEGAGTAIEIDAPTMTGGLALAIDGEQRARTEVIELTLECAVAREAKLRWRLPAHRGLETGLTFEALAGASRYRLPVAALPAWVWPVRIDGLELVVPGCSVRRVVALDAPLDRVLP